MHNMTNAVLIDLAKFNGIQHQVIGGTVLLYAGDCWTPVTSINQVFDVMERLGFDI